jgi:hypothetical protein
LDISQEWPWTYHLIPFPLHEGFSFEPYLDSVVAKGGSEEPYFSIVSGALPIGLELDESSGIISGIPAESGQFNFTIKASDKIYDLSDEAEYILLLDEGVASPGDIDINGVVDILDIIYLIDNKFKDGPPPLVPILADCNNDCVVDLEDIIILIDFKFKGGPPPVMGCATS